MTRQVICYWAEGGDLILGDNALSTNPVMLIWAHLIPSTRWSLQSTVFAVNWGPTAAPPSSWDKGWQDKHVIGNV